jgi:hypothetical protein
MTDVIPELVKAINDEYGVILASERNNLQRALAIGQKLVALRPLIAPKHGEWQAKLEEHCPKLSYETATLYIRLFEKQDVWRAAAAAKSVGSTDLTIDEARKLLAKPKPEPEPKDSGGDEQKYDDLEEDDNESDEDTAVEWLRALAADELVDWLQRVKDSEWMRDLAGRLAAHLKMKLVPVTPSVSAPPTGVGIERRI